MAVLPTPGSPMSTGLFLVRRESTCMTRSISRCATDDRVELLLAGLLGEVAAELVEHERAGRLVLAGRVAGPAAAPAFSLAAAGAAVAGSSWMTCWRTRDRSAPSFTSTWAATPSPSRMSPRRMCSVPM